MEDDGGERSSYVIGLIENRAKEFQHKDGPRHVAHYGLLQAEVAGLPSSVIETARSITSRITEKVIPSSI